MALERNFQKHRGRRMAPQYAVAVGVELHRGYAVASLDQVALLASRGRSEGRGLAASQANSRKTQAAARLRRIYIDENHTCRSKHVDSGHATATRIIARVKESIYAAFVGWRLVRWP